LLFRQMTTMAEAGIPIDPVSVAAVLEREGAGEHILNCLFRLAHEVVAFTPARRWAEIVVTGAQRRGLA
jgi:replicative DNA helicase